MATDQHYQLVVVGGGPTGVTAALRARELGATVALLERDTMGGTCTNDGCVPTRVLAKAARLMRDTAQFSDYGLVGPRPALDFPRLLNRAQQIVYAIHEKKQLVGNLRASGVAVFSQCGPASFRDPRTMETASGLTIRGDHFVLCTGGHARRLDFPGAAHAITHSDVWRLKELPPSVAIIGAAATGCQLASIFIDMGADVTLLDAAARIVPAEDLAVSIALAAAFREQGMQIQTGIGFDTRIEVHGADRLLYYTVDGVQRQLATSAVLFAVGWPGNIEQLRLDNAGVHHEKGYITVDPFLRTSASHIYAAGDITGKMMLVQSGQYEGRVAAENALLGDQTSYEHRIVPHGGFTDPEYASVGLTEQHARAQADSAVAVIPYSALDRAVIDGHTTGFCKLVVDRRTRHVLGAHVVGEQALEVVHVVAAAMAGGMPIETLANLEIAYPTYAAVVGLAARQLVRELGLAILSPQWRALKHSGGAEWEQADVSTTR